VLAVISFQPLLIHLGRVQRDGVGIIMICGWMSASDRAPASLRPRETQAHVPSDGCWRRRWLLTAAVRSISSWDFETNARALSTSGPCVRPAETPCAVDADSLEHAVAVQKMFFVKRWTVGLCLSTACRRHKPWTWKPENFDNVNRTPPQRREQSLSAYRRPSPPEGGRRAYAASLQPRGTFGERNHAVAPAGRSTRRESP